MDEERRDDRRQDDQRIARIEEQNKAQTKILVSISRDVRKTHEKIDLQGNRLTKVETDVKWHKSIAAVLIAWLHALHFWK